MKVVHINTSSIGGAAKAAVRLHEALLQEGIQSVFLYLNGPEIDVLQSFRINAKFSLLEKILFKTGLRKHYWNKLSEVSLLKENKSIPFTINYIDFDILKSEQASFIIHADIIHLHWITNCIDYYSFFNKVSQPIFWTLHDMNPFTGGCHYDNHCSNYKDDCKPCPQLKYPQNKSIAQKDLFLKNRIKHKNLYIISLNDWMKQKAKESKILSSYEHYVLPNSVDTNVFKMQKSNSDTTARYLKKKIGYVATYHSDLKGSDIFLELVEKYKSSTDLHWVYIGQKFREEFENCTYAGNLQKESELVDFYRSIDLLIVPSRGDNMPNVIVEALCSGTPVYASNVGGIPILINERNGRLISAVDIEEWKVAIDKFIFNKEQFDRLQISLEAINLYNQKKQADEIVVLYNNAIDKMVEYK